MLQCSQWLLGLKKLTLCVYHCYVAMLPQFLGLKQLTLLVDHCLWITAISRTPEEKAQTLAAAAAKKAAAAAKKAAAAAKKAAKQA